MGSSNTQNLQLQNPMIFSIRLLGDAVPGFIDEHLHAARCMPPQAVYCLQRVKWHFYPELSRVIVQGRLRSGLYPMREHHCQPFLRTFLLLLKSDMIRNNLAEFSPENC